MLQLSKSRIDLFQQCFFKYYFRYVKKIDVAQTIWPGTFLGEIVHESLEHYFLEKLKFSSKKQMKEYAKEFFSKRFKEKIKEAENNPKKIFRKPNGFNKKQFIIDGEKTIIKFLLFVNSYFKGLKFISELQIDAQWDKDTFFTGIIDLVVYDNNDNYFLFDFKSTKESNKFLFIDWNNDIQSLMYKYLSYKYFGYYLKSFGYLVVPYQDNYLFLKETTVSDIEKDKQLVTQSLQPIIDDIKLKSANPKPEFASPNFFCKFCEYNQQCSKLKII